MASIEMGAKNGAETTTYTTNPLAQLSETDARIAQLSAQLSEANALRDAQLSEVTAHNEQLKAKGAAVGAVLV